MQSSSELNVQCAFQKYILVFILFVASHPDVVKVTHFADPCRDDEGYGDRNYFKNRAKAYGGSFGPRSYKRGYSI